MVVLVIYGFGAGLLCQMTDDSGTNSLGVFGFARDGADSSGQFIARSHDGGATWVNNLVVKAAGDVSTGGVATPLGRLHIEQASTTYAGPAVYVNQADLDEPYFELVGATLYTGKTAISDEYFMVKNSAGNTRICKTLLIRR